MKITGLKTFVANVSRTNFVFVKLYTDEGIDGVGEATLEWKTLAVVAALEELERVLLGRDPFQSDALVEQLESECFVCRHPGGHLGQQHDGTQAGDG